MRDYIFLCIQKIAEEILLNKIENWTFCSGVNRPVNKWEESRVFFEQREGEAIFSLFNKLYLRLRTKRPRIRVAVEFDKMAKTIFRLESKRKSLEYTEKEYSWKTTKKPQWNEPFLQKKSGQNFQSKHARHMLRIK